MTEEQFEALVALMERIAYEATGSAVHQRRASDDNFALNNARRAFNLPTED